MRTLAALVILVILVILASIAAPAVARGDGPWAGTWDTVRPDGGGSLVLDQQGDRVSGTYLPEGGRLEGTITGSRFEGRWTEADRSGKIDLLLDADGRTFAGRDDLRGWWTGQRSVATKLALPVDLGTPRDAFSTFVAAANLARSGRSQAWSVAEAATEFAPGTRPATPEDALEAVQHWFDLIDLTTFDPSSLPDGADGDTVTFRLEQLRSGVTLPITMRRDSQGLWHAVVPGPEDVDAARKALLAIYGANPPTRESFQRLQNPRDTMRSFLLGMDRWNGDDGRALALSTLDLRKVPDLLRERDGSLMAHHLRRTLQQVGLVGLQSIPDDGTDRDPYVHFVHGLGSIAIAPSGPEAGAPWQFTQGSLARIRELYLVTEDLQPPKYVPPGEIPPHPYFTIRSLLREKAPFLLGRSGAPATDAWQLLAFLVALPAIFLLGRLVARTLAFLLGRIPGSPAQPPRFFLGAVTYIAAVPFMTALLTLIGAPDRIRAHTLPVTGSLFLVAIGAVAWHVLSVVGEYATGRVRRTPGGTDDILMSLLVAGGRLAIVLATSLGIAYLLSIPAPQILAGLGIGGLAFAIAARETLSNLFGAGNFVTDRPFRTGDWIEAGALEGRVEDVGMRSTRIRTRQDSIAIIPNGKLSDATINNLGARRYRALDLKILVTGGATPERTRAFVDAVRARILGDPVFVASESAVGMAGIEERGFAVVLSTLVDVRSDLAEIEARHALLIDVMSLAQDHRLRLGSGMEMAMNTEEGS